MVSPRPSRTPTAVFRLFADAQVATTSPKPANPINVFGFAPSATPSRDISANPRVISVAFELSPNPMPSTMPAAIAITFFTTPAISQPTTSVFVYTRKVGNEIICWIILPTRSSPHATTVAAGCPAKISRAKFGPVKTATGLPGINSFATSLIRRNVSRSNPFARLTIGTSAPTYLAT